MLLWLGFLTKERSRRYGMSGQRRRSGWRKGRLTVALVAAMIAMGALTAARAVAAEPPYLDPTQPLPVRVADITNSRLGSLLSGGGSAPSPNSPTAWADMYDNFQRAALATPLRIPLIYGVDAVHGHNNVFGATIYPHNIGLGATRDPALLQRIGRATAEEVAGTGPNWDFAPCLCVVRNDRWGRTYESYGEDPAIGSSLTTYVTGLQAGSPSILSTAKHYLGDGGTTGGDDQGNTELSEADLRAIHLPPFRAAIQRGVGSVMISYSSWNGLKMHANRYLITDVLKGELGFSGFVVSDWNAIDQIDGQPGFTAAEVRTAINAGLDMIMVPNDWRQFISLLRTEVQAGRVPMSRIDDANRRILTKKFELGLFEHPLTDRSWTSSVGSAAHRDVAREAVRKSQVLLKNRFGVLPLPKTAPKYFVAGKNADDIGNQSGGWTITWQGSSGATTPGTTILQGIRAAVSAGTTVTYNRDGFGIDGSYKAAIAVVGETPYAEGVGDRPGSMSLDSTDLAVLSRLKAAGVPVVVVLVSGRPLDIAAQLGDWDALVAAWLPGTEGRGVADVLFSDYNPTGKLRVTWMNSVSQQPINVGDGKTPLFAFGAGQRFPATQDPYNIIGAVYYDGQFGTLLERCTDGGCGQNVGWIATGDYLYYDGVDFGGTPPTRVLSRIASAASTGGTIRYRLDSPTGPVIATVTVNPTGGWQIWTSVTVPAGGATGVHRLYLTFHGNTSADFVNVNWFQFFRGVFTRHSRSTHIAPLASGSCP